MRAGRILEGGDYEGSFQEEESEVEAAGSMIWDKTPAAATRRNTEMPASSPSHP